MVLTLKSPRKHDTFSRKPHRLHGGLPSRAYVFAGRRHCSSSFNFVMVLPLRCRRSRHARQDTASLAWRSLKSGVCDSMSSREAYIARPVLTSCRFYSSAAADQAARWPPDAYRNLVPQHIGTASALLRRIP